MLLNAINNMAGQMNFGHGVVQHDEVRLVCFEFLLQDIFVQDCVGRIGQDHCDVMQQRQALDMLVQLASLADNEVVE